MRRPGDFDSRFVFAILRCRCVDRCHLIVSLKFFLDRLLSIKSTHMCLCFPHNAVLCGPVIHMIAGPVWVWSTTEWCFYNWCYRSSLLLLIDWMTEWLVACRTEEILRSLFSVWCVFMHWEAGSVPPTEAFKDHRSQRVSYVQKVCTCYKVLHWILVLKWSSTELIKKFFVSAVTAVLIIMKITCSEWMK